LDQDTKGGGEIDFDQWIARLNLI